MRDPGDLCASLIPTAMRLVATVHDEGGPEEVRQILRRKLPGIVPVDWVALCVVLAAMVDQSRTPEQLLGWTRDMTEHKQRARAIVAAGGGPAALARGMGITIDSARPLYEGLRREKAA